jgi:hypothetical protein
MGFGEALFSGNNDWFFMPLFWVDMPISIFCFGLLWAGMTAVGLISWGLLGTAEWYLIGLLVEKLHSETQEAHGIKLTNNSP